MTCIGFSVVAAAMISVPCPAYDRDIAVIDEYGAYVELRGEFTGTHIPGSLLCTDGKIPDVTNHLASGAWHTTVHCRFHNGEKGEDYGSFGGPTFGCKYEPCPEIYVDGPKWQVRVSCPVSEDCKKHSVPVS